MPRVQRIFPKPEPEPFEPKNSYSGKPRHSSLQRRYSTGEQDQPADEGYVLKGPELAHTRQYTQNRDTITLCGNLFHIMLGTMSSRVIAEANTYWENDYVQTDKQ